jgi:glycosyltransferase involved in cell wall biosynthesis
MKILHILYDDTANPWVGGGGAVRAFEINKRLAQKHQIYMLTGNFPNAKSGIQDGIHYNRIGYSKNYILSRLTFTVMASFYIRRFEYDIIVNDFSVFSPVFAYWYTKKPVVSTFYHQIGKQSLKKFWFFGVFAYLFEKIFLATARNIITISPSVTNAISRLKDQRRIECIYTGVDEVFFTTEPCDENYIAFLGRLDIYMKGLDVLLEAVRRLPDSDVWESIPPGKVKIAGSGPEKSRKKLEKLINDYGLNGKVELIGRLESPEKLEFFCRATVVVMPSRYEGWGISAIEASASGKAVIASNIPGLKDAVLDGKTGILVEPDNPDALAEAIQKALANREYVRQLGANGREWARNFKWDAIAEKQELFYMEIFNTQSR